MRWWQSLPLVAAALLLMGQMQAPLSSTGGSGSGGSSSGCVPGGSEYELLIDNGAGGCVDLGSLGTSGQVLTSNGSGVAPSWQTGSGGGGVTSVTGTSGQVTVSPTTGATVVSLPTTITQGETWSAAQTFADASTWSSGGIAGLTKLGIGMTPSNVLDITQSQNGNSFAQLLNGSTGTNAAAFFQLSNGSAVGSLYQTGQDWDVSGAPYAANQTGLQGDGSGGIAINTTVAQPIYFGINSGLVAEFDADGNLLLGYSSDQSAKLAVDGSTLINGALTLSGLGSGTQTSCLGLTSGNVVVPSSGACGSGGGGNPSVLIGAYIDTVAASTTYYCTIAGAYCANTMLVAPMSAPRAGTIGNLYCNAENEVDAAVTCTLYDNGSATDLVATFSTTATVASNTTDTVSVNQGDELMIQIVSPSGAATNRFAWSMTMQ